MCVKIRLFSNAKVGTRAMPGNRLFWVKCAKRFVRFEFPNPYYWLFLRLRLSDGKDVTLDFCRKFCPPNLMTDLGVKNNQYRLENCVMAREMEIFAKFVAN